MSSEFDIGWVTGLIESKGTFTTNTIRIKRQSKTGVKLYQYANPAFYLVAKDPTVLEAVKETMSMGKINRHGNSFHFGVRKKAEVTRLAEFLGGKFKSKTKTEQLDWWKKSVLEWKSRAWGEGAV